MSKNIYFRDVLLKLQFLTYDLEELTEEEIQSLDSVKLEDIRKDCEDLARKIFNFIPHNKRKLY